MSLPSAQEVDAAGSLKKILDPIGKERVLELLSAAEQSLVVSDLNVASTRAQLERFEELRDKNTAKPLWQADAVPEMAVTPDVYIPKEATESRDRIMEAWHKNGRKTIKPTVEMCRAFKNVELRLTFEQYQQPYMCMRIDLPNRTTPCWIYFGPNPPEDSSATEMIVWFWTIYQTPKGEAGLCFSQKPLEKSDWTIERRLFDESDDDSWVLVPECRTTIRVCLNCCLAATGFATRISKPICPHPQWPRKERRAWEAEQPQVVEFIDQHIRWYDEEGTPSEPGDGHHARPQTHWRKGHWRRQHFGKGRQEIRLVFIRPVLVNAAFFVGKPENTNVEIVGMPPVIRGGM